MNNNLKIVFCGLSIVLSACGGGGGGSPAPTSDTQAPSITSVASSAPNAGLVTLTANASDNNSVTGYCFKSSQTTPASTDACFQPANTQQITLTVPNTTYYVWAKDAAGNISSSSTVRGPCSTAGYAASDANPNPTVCVSTSLGEFVVELEATKAPITTANFLQYTNEGFYAGTVFHRVLSTFMVQGGGFRADLTFKTPTHSAIVLEAPATTGISNIRGTIAMARTNVLNSATSQFFINVVDNTFLDTSGGGGYAAFGNVISGLSTTIEAIRNVSVASNGAVPPEISLPVNLPLIQWAYQLK
jgi:cyclophilin family peptidyl-prolyl cis-trans isomerase